MEPEYRPPRFPIEDEPRINTMAGPLIVESAFPGWLPLHVQPNIPMETDRIAAEIVESVRAGAAAIHVHPRDPKTGVMKMDPLLLKQTLDPVLAECPDVYTANHSWYGKPGEPITYIDHTLELLELGRGTRYVEGSVVLITGNPGEPERPKFGHTPAIKEGVPWLEAHGIKPLFQIYDTHGIHWLAKEIIAPGLAKWKPFVVYLHFGKHHSTNVAYDPWSHLQVFSSFHAIKAAIPDCVVGIRAGGRNWLPLTTLAIMLGVDVVSVGMEDCLWMYPHKDEIMTKNSEVIRKVVTIARELGRDIATPAHVRRMFGHEPACASPVSA